MKNRIKLTLIALCTTHAAVHAMGTKATAEKTEAEAPEITKSCYYKRQVAQAAQAPADYEDQDALGIVIEENPLQTLEPARLRRQ